MRDEDKTKEQLVDEVVALRQRITQLEAAAERQWAEETLQQSDDHIHAGDRLREQGNLEEAIAEYSEAIRLTPELAVAYNNRGVTYAVLGQQQQAIQDLDQAIQLDLNYIDAYNNRGYAYVSLGQFERAVEDFDAAISLVHRPHFALFYNNRGYAYVSLGQFERAVEDFDAALRLNPSDPVVYNHRALAYAYLGKYEEAQRDVDRMVELGGDATVLRQQIEDIQQR